MRETILEKLHLGHLGIDGTTRRARETVFWPGYTQDIKKKIQQCSTCNSYSNQQPKEPMVLKSVTT